MYTSQFASLAVLAQAIGAWADTITYNWDVTWVNAAPDGFARPVIGINGEWPCPPINAYVGDTVVVNLKNSLGNQTTGLHFHGLNQFHTNYMDGASMVNSCPLVPDSTITYKFVADAPGTYWYHSHNMAQYPDGLRGPMIVHDPEDPYADDYDNEVILTVSDWYHDQTLTMVQAMLQPNNTQWRPPIPDGMIVNEGENININLGIGKTTRVRIISFAALAGFMVHFNSHPMNIIMTDGSYVQNQGAYQLRIAPAQRYDVLISGVGRDKGQNFPFLVGMDLNRDYTVTASWNFNQTGYLITDSSLSTDAVDVVDVWQPFDDSHLTPLDLRPAFGPVSQIWKLDFTLCQDVYGIPRLCFNKQTYVGQKTPTLYTAATVGDANTDPNVYGGVLPFIVGYGDVVDIVVNNVDAAIHPFHLHGHQFQVIDKPASGTGSWSGTTRGNIMPMRRDTIAINGASYAVLRFVANNPGVFLFHCHIEWHVEMGLTATLIEAPERLHNYPIPQAMLDSCESQDIPVSGNAAGNSDPNDYSGYNTEPAATYYGATWPPPDSPITTRAWRKPAGQKSPSKRFSEIPYDTSRESW
ncbi:hypothetical protein SCAR479_01186 [Seiridium cardinale]|uniref:Laccase n=1 Tax=Seiridium cardinale TaxID=138064 RepID=A0ABR2Y7Z0_9PEZI